MNDVNECSDSGATKAPAEVTGALTVAQVQSALTNLGHNGYGEIAYTTLSLKDRGLTAVSPLASFPFLQFVSLDDNHLTTLEPLAAIEGLIYLSARRNQLSESGVFPHLAGAAASLERLHLDGNVLRSLEGLSQFAYLTDLTVADNGLTRLSSSDFLPLKALTRFTASGNEIGFVDVQLFSGARQVRVVDLSGNQLTNLHFVAYVTANLETLRVARNRIASLGATISACQSLVTLDLAENSLATVEELQYLRPLRLLRGLRVVGNPFCGPARGTGSGEGRPNPRPASRASLTYTVAATGEVVAPDAADFEAAAAVRAADGGTVSPSGSTLDYAALAEPSTYGVVRHVLTANRMVVVPADLDRATELAKLPAARQVCLRLLYLLPSLMTLDDVEVEPQDVARAKFFFAEQSQSVLESIKC